MNCDNCRWFNKTGFVPGFGDCVLNREVHGKNHVCKNYEEYEPRPHGEWIEHRQFISMGYFVSEFECSNCHDDVWQKTEWQFCPNCGASMHTQTERS